MNFALLFMVLGAGFGVSFLVLDVAKTVARDRWPTSHAVVADNFRPFAIFLALFAGPALFVQAVWRMFASKQLRGIDGVLALGVSVGWAACYGVIVMEGARFFGFSLH